MYLVDTSVLIDYLKKKENSAVQFFEEILEKKLSFGITGIIYQEILQGASSKKDFEKLKQYLETQRFYHPKDSILSYEAAAELYFSCRTKGITLRSTIDCLIAQIAIEHDLVLLHNDKDYLRIHEVAKELRLVSNLDKRH